ncbi:Protocadherin-9 [Pitangus sulphuratus]|nr:Protocadherin-9 [Pitangus sulphuratus]
MIEYDNVKKSQRRVTFHLPDGSQESCSDSGLGDHEPVGGGTLISHPLPLVQPQDEFYDQASPDKRTEADGNSDPNSDMLSISLLLIDQYLLIEEYDNLSIESSL